MQKELCVVAINNGSSSEYSGCHVIQPSTGQLLLVDGDLPGLICYCIYMWGQYNWPTKLYVIIVSYCSHSYIVPFVLQPTSNMYMHEHQYIRGEDARMNERRMILTVHYAECIKEECRYHC